jgi:hypothetical protein
MNLIISKKPFKLIKIIELKNPLNKLMNLINKKPIENGFGKKRLDIRIPIIMEEVPISNGSNNLLINGHMEELLINLPKLNKMIQVPTMMDLD